MAFLRLKGDAVALRDLHQVVADALRLAEVMPLPDKLVESRTLAVLHRTDVNLSSAGSLATPARDCLWKTRLCLVYQLHLPEPMV